VARTPVVLCPRRNKAGFTLYGMLVNAISGLTGRDDDLLRFRSAPPTDYNGQVPAVTGQSRYGAKPARYMD